MRITIIISPLLSLFLILLPVLKGSLVHAQSVADIPLSINTHPSTTSTTPRRQFSGGRPGWDPRWGIGPVIPPPGVLEGLQVTDDNSDDNGGSGDPPSPSPPSSSDTASLFDNNSADGAAADPQTPEDDDDIDDDNDNESPSDT